MSDTIDTFSDRHTIPNRPDRYCQMFFSISPLPDCDQITDLVLDRCSDHLVQDCRLEITVDAISDEHHDVIAALNASRAQFAYLSRARQVVTLTVESGRAGSIFTPFFACQAAVCALCELFEGVAVDESQSLASLSCRELIGEHWQGIPLTRAFLTVKGYRSGDHLEIVSQGMSRFGLPELRLNDVPVELGVDGAYLMRAVAQYLWSCLDWRKTELTVPATIELPATCLELSNESFREATVFPVGLRLRKAAPADVIEIVAPPLRASDYVSWLEDTTADILRFRILNRAGAASRDSEPTGAIGFGPAHRRT